MAWETPFVMGPLCHLWQRWVVLWPSSYQTCWHRSLLPAVREEEITLCSSHGAASEGRQHGDHLLSVTPGESSSGHAKGNAMRWYSSIPWADVYNWKKLKFSLQPRISMDCSRSGWAFIFFFSPQCFSRFTLWLTWVEVQRRNKLQPLVTNLTHSSYWNNFDCKTNDLK